MQAPVVPGIYAMGAITVVVAAVALGGLFRTLGGRLPSYLWLLALGLPLSAIVNLLVKRPLSLSVAQAAGIQPGLRPEAPLPYLAVLLLLAPVTEEAIKVAPLLVPRLRALVVTGKGKRKSALWVGAWLGLGFGLGEAAFLSYGVSLNPRYAEMPWHMFQGFFGERIAVCLVHAVLTGIVVVGISRGVRWWLLAYAAAVGLHALVNVGAMLYQLGLISDVASHVSLAGTVVLLVVIFERLRGWAARETATAAEAEEVIYIERLQHVVK